LDIPTWQAIEVAVINNCSSDGASDLPMLHDRKYPHLTYKAADELLGHIKTILEAAGCSSEDEATASDPVITRSKARRIRKSLVEARRTMWLTEELRNEALQSCREWFEASQLSDAEDVKSDLSLPDLAFDLNIPNIDVTYVNLWNGKRRTGYSKITNLTLEEASHEIIENNWKVAYLVDAKGKEHRSEPRRYLDTIQFIDHKSGHALATVYVGVEDLVLSV